MKTAPILSCLLLPVVIPAAGCRSAVTVEETATVSLEVSRAFDADTREGTEIHTAGGDTVLTWLDTRRRIVFKGVTGYRGTFAFDSVTLVIGDWYVEGTPHRIAVKMPAAYYLQDLTTERFRGRHVVVDENGVRPEE